MADMTPSWGGMTRRFHDNGDGTFSEQVYLDSSAGGTINDVTAAIEDLRQDFNSANLDPGQALMAASLPVVLASDQTKIPVHGATAHDAPDTDSPQKIGFRSASTLSGLTLPATGDRVDGIADLDSAQFVRPQCALGDIVVGTASNTDGTVTTVLAAASAGIKQYLTCVALTNMHATTTAYVELYSGSTSRWILPCPPGGVVYRFDPPLPPNAAAETWRFDPSTAVTTIYCSMLGFKSKV